MATSFQAIVLCSVLLISLTAAQSSFRPESLILPVSKDPSTQQYITQIKQRTPLVPLNLTLDLGGPFLWVDCDQTYSSTTYRPARCGSAPCSLVKTAPCRKCVSSPRPGCNNNTCGIFSENTITFSATTGDLGSDVLSLLSTDGKNPGRSVSVPNFLFVCVPMFLRDGLAVRVDGMAGLGRTRISLPSQFSASFNFSRKFAICLTSRRSPGVVIFGNGPYIFLPNIDASSSLTYTPLIINPVSTSGVSTAGEPSTEYFIGVKSIKIREKTVGINTTLLSIDREGNGGTKISNSTITPYTTLEASIYQAVVKAFLGEIPDVPKVVPVPPFQECFNSKSLGSTRLGAAVPEIDLVLQSESVVWRIFGANSMVKVGDDVLCLGFVDGGVNPRTSIVIGGHQIENNLLQFDLASSRLGFSSLLFGRQTTCANFNFTSNA